jgi:hypothetical protein
MTVVLKLLITELGKWFLKTYVNTDFIVRRGLCMFRAKVIKTKTKVDDYMFNQAHESTGDMPCDKIIIKDDKKGDKNGDN